MNSIWKRSLAMFLSIVMVFGMLPVNAFATGVDCEHSYASEVTKEAACEDMGETTYTCELCGDVYTEEISATGHAWGEGVETAATCTEDGYTTYTCGNCGTTKTEGIIAATGHDMVDGACTVCGKPEETEDDSTEESSEAPAECNCKVKCNEQLNSACPVCGAGGITACEGEAAHEHSYQAVVTAPTCGEDGYTTYTCADETCKHTYTDDVVPATEEHDYVDGVCTVCGGAEPEAEEPSYDVDTMSDAEVAALLVKLVNAEDEDGVQALVEQLDADRLNAVIELCWDELPADEDYGTSVQAETDATVTVYKKVSYTTDTYVDGFYYELIDTDVNESGSPLENAVTALKNAGVTSDALILISGGTLVVTNRQDITISNVTIKGAGEDKTTITGDASKFNNGTDGLASNNLKSEYKALIGSSQDNVKLMDLTVDADGCGVVKTVVIFKQPADLKTIRINSGKAVLENVTISGSKTRSNLMVGTSSTEAEVVAVNVTVNDAAGGIGYSTTEIATGSKLTQEDSILGGAIVGATDDLGAGYYKATSGDITVYTTIPYAIDLYNQGVDLEILAEQDSAQGVQIAVAMASDLAGGDTMYGKDADGMYALAVAFKAALEGLSADTGVNASEALTIVEKAIAENVWGAANVPVTPPTEEEESPVVIPEEIVDTIVGDNATEEEKAAVQTFVNEIKANTALNDYAPTNVPEGAALVIKLTGMAVADSETAVAPTRIVYDVAPMQGETKVENLTEAITFRLPIPASVTESYAKVYHGEDLMDTYPIEGEDNGKYVEVTSADFSEYTVVPTNEAPAAYVAKIGEQGYETFAAAMNAANALTGDVTVEIYGEVEFVDGMELKNGGFTAINFKGMTDGAKITINQTAGGDYLEAHGKTVSFTDLILAKANPAWSGNAGHMGNYFSVQGGTVTYTRCTFPNGASTNTGTATYNSCTFENASEYGLWVYDDALVTVNGGTINSKKGIKVYSEGEESVTSTLTVEGATFTENVTEKPAVAIGYAQSITLIGNTYNNTKGVLELDSGSDADCNGITFVAQDANGNDIASTLTAVDRSNNNAACGVLVDGKIYTTVAEAAKDANAGSTVTLLHNSTEIVELAEGVILNKNNYTADGVTVVQPVAQIGDKKYTSLDTAFAEAAEGDTITLLADATPTLTSQSAITKASTIDLGGKTLTLTEDDLYFGTTTFKNGTIVVAPTVKASTAVFWMFANQTLIFDDVDIVATGVTGTYLIGINGGTGSAVMINNSSITIDNDAQADLSTVICDNGNGNSVVIENSTIDVDNIGGRFYLGGENGTITVKDSNIDLDGVKEGFYLRAGQNLSVEGTSNVDIVLNSTDGRYGINMEAASATYTKADTATVNGTVYKAPVKVTDKASLDAAIAAAQPGDVITLANDIDYTGNTTLAINKAITLNLGGKTLTTHGTFGGLKLDGGSSVTNGKLNHAGTVAAIKVTNATEISDLEIDATGTSSSKNAITGIQMQENCVGVKTIKNVTIHSTAGQGLANGIETYNCGAGGNVIGTMENVTIDVVGTAMNISAPCGTATNCSFKGGVHGIELWIKGTYSASLDLREGCTVEGGIYAHDEFTSNPDAVNEGTLSLVIDESTSANIGHDDITLTIARAENVMGELKEVMDNAVATVGNTYYATLEAALKAVTAENNEVNILKDITITEDWDCRSTGAKFTVPVVINGNDKTIKFTGNISDKNWDTAFRFESDATINGLIIDMSEIANTGKYRAITAAGNLTVEGCKFIGKASANGRAIIFGEGAGANVGNLNINVIGTKFINWTRGLTDNENGQDVKTVYAKENTFTDASVFLSAAETINFDDNTVTGGEVDLRSYAKADTKLSVNANGNTLDTTQENVITNAATVNAQPEFKIAPKGTITYGYTDQTNIWGEASGNAKESFVIKVYAGDTLMATTNLNNVGGIIDGDVTVTWHNNFVGNFDDHWTTTWENGYPNKETQPTTVKLFVDGQEVAESDVKMNGPDNVNPVVWEELDIFKPNVAQLEDANGNVIGIYKDFESALAAAITDANITTIELLADIEETEVNLNTTYDLAENQNLTISAENKVTVKLPTSGSSGLNIYLRNANSTLTIDENVTIEGMGILANGFATTGQNTTIDGSIKAVSLKQWTSNGTITISETGKVELGYGDGQFDMAYGNGTVTITGNGDKTAAQFKAGYSGTRGNGNTLNLKDTYFEAGAWFNVNGSNGTFNADNSLLKVSNGAGNMTIASSGNVINLTNGSELAVANLTIGAGNTVKLDKTSSVEATKITGAGTIQINAADMQAGDVVDVNADLSGFTGKIEVINSTLEPVIENGKITLVKIVAQIGGVMYSDLHKAMVEAKAGETVRLVADVDLAGTEWEPVSFKGTFDGGIYNDAGEVVDTYTISNLTINKPGVSNTGFITSLNGTFKNVTFTNPTVTGGDCTGVVAGRAGGGSALAENITVNGTIKVETTHTGYARAAVIVGGWAYGNYKNITVDGGDKAVSYVKHTGGGDGRYVAGIVGHADDVESYVNCTVQNITISGGWLCGAIAGPGPSDGLASGCTVANVDMNADYSGGMFGWYYGDGTIENSSVTDVTFTDGSTNNGAIGGYSANSSANVSNVTIQNVKNEDGEPLLDHVAEVNDVYYFSLNAAAKAAKEGDEIVILADTAESVTLPAGVTLNGNGKTIDGTVMADGDLTIAGATTVGTFNPGWYNNTITIGKGASLKVTSGRMTVSYGNIFNITGSVTDVKTADKASLTPSLELVGGISFNGDGGDVMFNVTNAYVKLGDSTTKPGGATGKFNMNFTNSIVDFTKTLKTYMPTESGLAPEFNFTAKDSVVDFASHLELWLDNTTMTLDKTNLTVGGSFANAGTVNVTNGANFVVKAPIMSTHGGNTGTINVTGGTFELADSNQDWENAGTIKVVPGGKLITNDFKNVGDGKIVVDAAALDFGTSNVVVVDGNGVYNFESTTEILNKGAATVSFENGDVILAKNAAVAQIGEEKYTSLAEALTAAKNGETITLIWAEGDAAIDMRGTVSGKTVTITGTADVDWSKGWLYVGRNGADDGKLIFDKANLTSVSNSREYGINVSGAKKDSSDTFNGTVILKDSTIVLDYMIQKNVLTLDNSTLTVNNGCGLAGRDASDSASGVDATATTTLSKNSKLILGNCNGMGLGYEGIGILNVDATSTFETTQAYQINAKGTLNLAGTAKIAGTLTNNGKVVLTGVDATLTSNDCGNVETNVADYKVVYADGAYKLVKKVYVAEIDGKGYETFAEALEAVQDGETIELVENATISEGTISEGTIKLPAALKNVTFKGAEGAVLKDMTIMAADGNSIDYQGLTFDGIIFDNSNIVITGRRSGTEIVKDLTVTNCEFKNVVRTGNQAAVHMNMDETTAVNGFTFTNNEINGISGSDNSGIYGLVTGTVTIDNNVFNNVAYRPALLLPTTNDEIADTITFTNNTVSNSVQGCLQISADEGTDTVKLAVTENIFKDIPKNWYYIFASSFAEGTEADFSKNYFEHAPMDNSKMFCYNDYTQNVEDLVEMGVFPYYADEAKTELVYAPTIMVTYADGSVEYFSDILEAVPYTTNYDKLQGATIKLMEDITAKGIRFMETNMVLDLNGHTYTINNATGSSNTNTSGFQIREDAAKVTIKNGTINVAEPADMVVNTNVVWMFNSYSADFTVEDVTVDCTNMAWSYGEGCYVHVSRPGDNTNFTGTTKIEGFDSKKAGNAINVGGTMTIADTAEINGLTVELDVGAKLTAQEGLHVVAPDGYGVKYENGVYSTIKYVAKIGNSYYATLAEALAAVGAGDVVIELLDNAALDYDAREAYGTAETTSLTINGNGKTLTLNQKDSDWSSIGLANADAKLVLNNMTIEKTGYGDTSGEWNTHAIIFSSNLEMTEVTVNNAIAVEDGATLSNVTINEANGYYGLWISGNGQTVTVNGGEINATNGGRGIKIADEYVDSPKAVTLTVDGTKFTTAKKAAVLVTSTAGAKITASNVDITNVAADNVNFVWNDEERGLYYHSVKVYGDATKAQENEESFPIVVHKDSIEGTVRAYVKNLDELFTAKSAQIPLSSNYIDLRGNVVAEEKVNVSYDNNWHYTFGTSVEGGVTMDFKYADNWNFLPHFTLGEDITMNVPYLQVIGGDISIAGTINTNYLYLYGTGEGVTITETGIVNANVAADKTVQVKGGSVLTVNGVLNTDTLNVWTQDANNSELIVSGANAKVNATNLHAWNGKDGVSAQKVTIANGATLTATTFQADRGSEVTVNAATLTAENTILGYEGNTGIMKVLNNATITNTITLGSVDSYVEISEPMADGKVITTVPESVVVYEDGKHIVASKFVAQNVDTGKQYESVFTAMSEAKSGQTVELLRDCTDSIVLVPAYVTLDLKGYDLTVGYLPVFGEIADSTDGQGSVIVATNSATFTATNKQMPLYDGSAYRFFNYSFRVGGGRMQSNNTSVKFGAGIDFDNVVAYDLIQAADNAGLTVGVKLRWDNESRNYNFQNATIQTYGSSKEGKPTGNFMLTFTVHGVNEIAGKTLYMDYIFTSYGVGDQCTCEITIPATE